MIDVRKQQSSSMIERRSRVTIAEAVLLLARVPTASEKGVQSRDGDRNTSNLQPRGDKVMESIQGGQSRAGGAGDRTRSELPKA